MQPIRLLFKTLIFLSLISTAQAQTIKISGSVLPPESSQMSVANLPVVILKFRLGQDGNLTTDGPIARTATDEQGRYQAEIPADAQAAYQLGSRFNGELISTSFFFIKPGQTELQQDLELPGLTDDLSVLTWRRSSIIAESGLGQLTFTEIHRVQNNSKSIVTATESPLVFELPAGAQEFRLLQTQAAGIPDHQLNGQLLEIKTTFQQGDADIAFQYQIPAFFGSLKVQKRYSRDAQDRLFFVPTGGLKLQSEELVPAGSRDFGQVKFTAYNPVNPQNRVYTLHFSNVPVDQQIYLTAVGIMVLLLFLVVIVYWKKRLQSNAAVHATE